MAEEVLATVQELRDATDRAIQTRDSEYKTNDEKNTEWLQWFSKRGVRLLKDAIQFGKYSISVDLPYQPDTKQDEKSLMRLRKQLQQLIPGCVIDYIEEELEDTTQYTMLISWEDKV